MDKMRMRKSRLFCPFIKGRKAAQPANDAFSDNHSGAAVVEFALIIPAFFGVFFLLLDTTMVFLSSSLLDSGLEASKRMISTGEINTIAPAQRVTEFRNRFCQNITSIVRCANVQFDIRTSQNIAPIVMAAPLVKNALNTKAFSSNFGTACDFVVIRAYYEMVTMSSFLRSDVIKNTPLRSIITSSVAFRNEEYANC